jgi:hypothetical protein
VALDTSEADSAPFHPFYALSPRPNGNRPPPQVLLPLAVLALPPPAPQGGSAGGGGDWSLHSPVTLWARVRNTANFTSGNLVANVLAYQIGQTTVQLALEDSFFLDV